jgi:hypothetical protein
MSEYLPFWPKAAIGAYIADDQNVEIFTRALPTNGFTEVVLQVQWDGQFATLVTSLFDVVPQISNDGINWKDLTSPAIQITGTTSVPVQKTEKFTEIGAFMRVKVKITNDEGSGSFMGTTVLIAGAGRS